VKEILVNGGMRRRLRPRGGGGNRPAGSIARLAAIAIASLAALAAASPSSGGDTPGTTVVSLVIENDLFYKNDWNYTSGLALAWVPAGDATPVWMVRFARWLPWFPDEGQVRHGYVFGQNVYTPRDITLADPPLDDRPYAGWLYGSIGLGVETGRQLDQVWMSLGVVGPASLAEEAQEFIHQIINDDEPQGWDTQLGNELGVELAGERSWRGLAATTLGGLALDLLPHVGGSLGNIYTYADGGVSVRYGKNLTSDYGPPRIRPGLPGSCFFTATDKFAWYVFVGIEGRVVARNIFLDGNTFVDSRSVDKEPLVGDVQWGLALTWPRVRVGYTHVVRSREFTTQDEHDEFGSLSVSVSF